MFHVAIPASVQMHVAMHVARCHAALPEFPKIGQLAENDINNHLSISTYQFKPLINRKRQIIDSQMQKHCLIVVAQCGCITTRTVTHRCWHVIYQFGVHYSAAATPSCADPKKEFVASKQQLGGPSGTPI